MADTIIKTKVRAPAFVGDGSGITGLQAVADGASGSVLIGQGLSSNPLYKVVSGDVAITNLGVTSLDQSLIKVATVTLSAAEIIALFSAPKVLVAAPGASKVLVLRDLTIQFKATATAFLLGGTSIKTVYHGDTTALTANVLAGATILANSSFTYYFGAVNTAGGSVLLTNTGLDLMMDTRDFTSGTGTAVVTVRYSVLTLG